MQFSDKFYSDEMIGDFLKFTSPGVNRLDLLKKILEKYGIPYTQIELAGTRHIVIKFPKDSYSPQFTVKTILAHYDCVPGSPGANDNGSSVFLLLGAAKNMMDNPGIYNTRIIFTGNEELVSGQGVKEQGAYPLGLGLKSLGCLDDDIYVLDCMGRGDTLILSDVGLYSGGGKILMERNRRIYERAVDICRGLKQSGKESVFFSLPVPYGDNAGLSAAGLSVQAVTVLPGAEALEFYQAIRNIKGKKPVVFSREFLEKNTGVKEAYPATWRIINTPRDDINCLNREAFDLAYSFIWALVTKKYPVY